MNCSIQTTLTPLLSCPTSLCVPIPCSYVSCNSPSRVIRNGSTMQPSMFTSQSISTTGGQLVCVVNTLTADDVSRVKFFPRVDLVQFDLIQPVQDKKTVITSAFQFTLPTQQPQQPQTPTYPTSKWPNQSSPFTPTTFSKSLFCLTLPPTTLPPAASPV